MRLRVRWWEGDVSQVLMYYILYSPFAQSISSILITGCEFCVTQRLLALAKMEGNSGIRRRYGQKNAWYFVAEHRMEMCLVAMFFGPHAPEAQTAQLSVFSHCFKRLERFTKLATSSIYIHV